MACWTGGGGALPFSFGPLLRCLHTAAAGICAGPGDTGPERTGPRGPCALGTAPTGGTAGGRERARAS
eukprot:7396455-Alexandrium_andersonii.AAC.1